MWQLVLAAAGAQPQTRGGCGRAGAAPYELGRTAPVRLDVGGVERSFLLTLPKQYDPDHAYPLVLGFHGWSNTAADQASYDGFAAKAVRGHLIAVHPEGVADPPKSWNSRPYQGWSAVGSSMASGNGDDLCAADTRDGAWPCSPSCGTCSRCSYAACSDDVGFVEELLNELERQLCVDTAQVFAHGCSNGGQMVFQLLQSRLAPRFAALVPEVALPHAGRLQAPEARVRFLGLWGDADEVMPAMPSWTGQPKASNDGFFYSDAQNVTSALARAFHCSPGRHPVATRATRDDLRCEEHACSSGGAVVQCFFSGGHVWPKVAHNLVYQFYFGTFRAKRHLLRSAQLLQQDDDDDDDDESAAAVLGPGRFPGAG